MGCLQSYFKKAQNAALSPRAGDQDGTEPIKEAPLVTEDVTNNDTSTPPMSPASDSGAASGTSSPVGSPTRTPGPQAVRTKLTTTGDKHPSPVFQQALKTAFDAETRLSDRASISPKPKRNINIISPTEDKSQDSTTTSPVPESKTSSICTTGGKDESNSGPKSHEYLQFANTAANNLARFLPSNLSSGDSVSESKFIESQSEKKADITSLPSADNYKAPITNVEVFKSEISSKVNDVLNDTNESIKEISQKETSLSSEIKETSNVLSNEVSEKVSEISDIINTEKSEISNNLNEAKTNIGNKVSELSNDIDEKSNTVVASVEENTEHVISSANDRIEEVTTNISEAMSQLGEKASIGANECYNDMEEKVSEISKHLNQGTESAINNAEQEMSVLETELIQTADKVYKDARENVLDTKSNIAVNLEDAKAEINENINSVSETAENLKPNILEKSLQLEEEANTLRTTVDENITEVTCKVDNQIDETVTEISEAACSIAAEIRESAGEMSDTCIGKVDEVMKATENNIGTAGTEISENITVVADEVGSEINDTISNINERTFEINENVIEQINEASAQVENVTEISNIVTNNIKEESEKSVLLLELASNNTNELMKEAESIVDAITEEAASKLLQEKQEIAENVQEIAEENINLLEDESDEIKLQGDNIEAKILEAVSDTMTTAVENETVLLGDIQADVDNVEERIRKISVPIAIEGMNVTDERSASPVATDFKVSEPLAAASFEQAFSLKETAENNNVIDENTRQTPASKRISELGSEDFKPQTPEIVTHSPDQSTYDDVSAGVLLDEDADNIPVVPQIEELAQALIEEEASQHEHENTEDLKEMQTIGLEKVLDDNSASIAQIVIMDAADNELQESMKPSDEKELSENLVEVDNKPENNLIEVVTQIELLQNDVDMTITKNEKHVTMCTPPPSPEHKQYDTLVNLGENKGELLSEMDMAGGIVAHDEKTAEQIADELASTAEAACEELDNILQEALIEANARKEEIEAQLEEGAILSDSIGNVETEYKTKNDDELDVKAIDNIDDHTTVTDLQLIKENKIIESMEVNESESIVQHVPECNYSKDCKTSKRVRCECIGAQSPVVGEDIRTTPLFNDFTPSAPPPTTESIEKVAVADYTESAIDIIDEEAHKEDVTSERINNGNFVDIIPAIPVALLSNNEMLGEGGSSTVDADNIEIEEISSAEANKAVEAAVEQLYEEISNDVEQTSEVEDSKLSRETGEILLLPESNVQIINEDATFSESLQSSCAVGNEGLGAVSSVVIRYSISEGDVKQETDIRLEDDAFTKIDKDIADTLIAAVRDSVETTTESGDGNITSNIDEVQITESEPAEVASAQTSSSKDAASLEHDDIQLLEPTDQLIQLLDEFKPLQQQGTVIDNVRQVTSPTTEEKDAAATRIQATYRGYQIRKATNTEEAQNTEVPVELTEECLDSIPAETEEVVDETLKSEEVVLSDAAIAELAAVSSEIAHAEAADIWRAVPAQTIVEDEQLPVEIEETLDRVRQETSSPSALAELMENCTLLAATPLAYPDLETQKSQPSCSVASDLVEHTTLVATAPITYIDSPSSTFQQMRDTYSSSGECADISASATEPCVTWNGARAVDQESGELVTEDEDERVWATLEKEIEETKAATKIQAGFRGHKARQALLQREDAVQMASSIGSDVMIATPFSGVRHTGEFHDSLALLPLQAGNDPIDDADSATTTAYEPHELEHQDEDHAELLEDDDMSSSNGNFLDKAATKIQSTFRGFKTRNDLKKERSPVNSQVPRVPPPMSRVQSAPQILIEDSVEDRSAAKIQAGVRGYLTRQRLKREKSPQLPPSPEMEDAVVKIQAGFRGYKARQAVKSLREGKDS